MNQQEKQAIDDTLARFRYMRDNGHSDFVTKANDCDGLFAGDGHWPEADRCALEQSRRPVLTINAVLPTVSYLMGNQLQNSTDVTFAPRRNGATDALATVMAKVYRQITDNNRMDWLRSEWSADGLITSRGFIDARMNFEDSLTGDVKLRLLDPRQVLIDPAANSYDPAGWNDVIITHRYTVAEIESIWGKGKATRAKRSADSTDNDEDVTMGADAHPSFGGDNITSYNGETTDIDDATKRNILVVDRQHRVLTRAKFFVWLRTGEMRLIPSEFDDAQTKQFLTENPEVTVSERLTRRVRWTVATSSGVLLHDEWSPYDDFTVFPYFPYFRRGKTVGVVENLRDPQRLLNRTTSQELHILNSSANGGWKVKRNNLSNMTVGELEQRGAETGVVIEVEDMEGLDRLQPNQVPSGLDRLAYKANEIIKQVSGVSDYMMGAAREDVSAKSVVANQQSGATGSVKPLKNLQFSEMLLAKHILNMVQSYYTDERILRIVTDPRSQTTEDLVVNQMTETGILNDLTVGEFDVVVVNTPRRELEEDSEFQQAVTMRTEMGIAIPDEFIIRSSRLRERAALLESIAKQQNDTQAQQAQLAQDTQAAELDGKRADAELKRAKAQQALTPPPKEKDNSAIEMAKLKMDFELQSRKLQLEMELKSIELEMKQQAQQREAAMKQQAQEDQARQAARDSAVQRTTQRVNARRGKSTP